jgi:DHA1 family bicyclomycin/chloramphenicol resistance-like MFS transporter
MSNSVAGAISVRPDAAGTASGAMGFLQMGIGSLVSQFGAYLGGHFATTLPLTAIFVLSAACASTMIFLVPRRTVVVSEELMEQAEEEESGML